MNSLTFAHARAHVRALMTRKSCAVGMHNAIIRNYLKCIYIYSGHALSYIKTLSLASLQGDVAALAKSHMNGFHPL